MSDWKIRVERWIESTSEYSPCQEASRKRKRHDTDEATAIDLENADADILPSASRTTDIANPLHVVSYMLGQLAGHLTLIKAKRHATKADSQASITEINANLTYLPADFMKAFEQAARLEAERFSLSNAVQLRAFRAPTSESSSEAQPDPKRLRHRLQAIITDRDSQTRIQGISGGDGDEVRLKGVKAPMRGQACGLIDELEAESDDMQSNNKSSQHGQEASDESDSDSDFESDSESLSETGSLLESYSALARIKVLRIAMKQILRLIESDKDSATDPGQWSGKSDSASKGLRDS